MTEYRKSIRGAKNGPKCIYYAIEEKTPIFYGLFHVWLFKQNISREEYLSPFPAEFFLA